MDKTPTTKCASWQEAGMYPGYRFTAKDMADAWKQFEASPNTFDPVEVRWCERDGYVEVCFVKEIE